MIELCILSAAFLATYYGVALFRSWTVKRGVLDLPNERSSHIAPTPRGGGLIIAVAVLAAYLIGSFFISYNVSWAFVAGSILIVSVSWLDDIYSISYIWRLLVHSLAAAIVIYANGYISTLPLPGTDRTLELGWFGAVLTFCWIVWLVNAYNFMDGIDGIASVQAVTAGIGWAILGINLNVPVAWMLGGTILFVNSAFLLHNWPPARIFMGDAGSAFLGFGFATLPLLVKPEVSINDGYLLIAAILFVWLFVFDSAFTFMRRAFRGEKVWQAHREHLYQRLVLSFYSHRKTTLLYGIISLAISAAAAVWLTSAATLPTFWVFLLVVVESGFLLVLCWQRKCLFGKIA